MPVSFSTSARAAKLCFGPRPAIAVCSVPMARSPAHPSKSSAAAVVSLNRLAIGFRVPPKGALLLARLSLWPHSSTAMLFTKKLRGRVKSGEVTASVRIWKTPHVKAGGKYRLEEGHIEVTSIREITWEDLTDKLARDTGFKNLIDMMKTAKHGSGSHIYYVRFEYRAGSA